MITAELPPAALSLCLKGAASARARRAGSRFRESRWPKRLRHMRSTARLWREGATLAPQAVRRVRVSGPAAEGTGVAAR
jgi:hypothetical protein